MTTGVGFMNRRLQPLTNDDGRAFLQKVKGEIEPSDLLTPYLKAAQLRLDKEDTQLGYLERFREESGMPILEIPNFSTARKERPHSKRPTATPVTWLDEMVDVIDHAATVEEPVPAQVSDG